MKMPLHTNAAIEYCILSAINFVIAWLFRFVWLVFGSRLLICFSCRDSFTLFSVFTVLRLCFTLIRQVLHLLRTQMLQFLLQRLPDNYAVY